MTTSSKLVFFGTETFSLPSLKALVAADYNVIAIVTKPDSRKGRGKKSFISPIKQFGLDHNIPVLQPDRVGAIEADLLKLGPVAGVLVAYGKIIPSRILNVFEPIGIINLHPSALPRYRGPSPIEAAILNGDSETALSIMKPDTGMDTGPIYGQKSVVLSGKETKPSLTERLAQLGADYLLELLPAILSGSLKPRPQENNDVSVTSLISKADGLLNPLTDDAYALERKVRAYQGYPKPHLNIAGFDVIVTSAKPNPTISSDKLVVPCVNSTYLEVEQLIAPSGRSMSGTDFIRGYLREP